MAKSQSSWLQEVTCYVQENRRDVTAAGQDRLVRNRLFQTMEASAPRRLSGNSRKFSRKK
ncbi:hypothetical protein E2C01_075970 [Portunus trituberculatus]|uniref:Uncharacterized protein n=1 Tax=Portunus trituberculatus TaxID=210409 RepID=A0A5B7IKT4_PORTR|nr:hypothetical protein [Portunus trituberculatus]